MKLSLFSAVLALLLGLSAQSRPMERPEEEDLNTNETQHGDFTSRLLEANKAISHLLVQGDVALSKKRNAMRCWSTYCKWKKSYNGLVEVPYTLSDYYFDDEKAQIKRAMETFHKKTCIRFVPHSGQTDFLSIESELGCWSTIGRDGGHQVLSLSVYGCLDPGTIQHELLHALGFNHEHTRSDRDQHVRINWQNVSPEQAHNFDKVNTNNLNTPYDYSSVMQYGRTFFSYNFEDTITPIPDNSVPIGQKNGMSRIDILRVNRLYECNI